MAQAITCDSCNTEPAVLLLTQIDSGDVTGLGASCAGPFLYAAALALGFEPDGTETEAAAVTPVDLESGDQDEAGLHRTIAEITETGPRGDDDAEVEPDPVPAGDAPPF